MRSPDQKSKEVDLSPPWAAASPWARQPRWAQQRDGQRIICMINQDGEESTAAW